MHKSDTFEIVSAINSLVAGRKVKAIYIDGTGGYGGGIADTLRLHHSNVYEINFGGKSPDDMCANNRAYMYQKLRDAINEGFYVDDPEIREEICAQRIKLSNNGLFQLVPKDEIKEYLKRSCDLSDALALSFMNTKEEQSHKTITPQMQNRYMKMFL